MDLCRKAFIKVLLVIIKFIIYCDIQIHFPAVFSFVFSPVIYSSIFKQNTVKFAFTEAEKWD